MKLVVPDQTYNAIELIDTDKLVDKNQIKLLAAEISQYRAGLCALGNNINIDGSVIYNPCGTADILHTFGLSGHITDVFCQGFEKFGQPQVITEFPTQFTKMYTELDQYRESTELRSLDTGGGIGGLIIRSIIFYLNANIEGLYYFDILENGDLKFLNRQDIKQISKPKNAVVSFRDDNVLKRYWYIQCTFPYHQQFNYYINFINKLTFDILVIKGAHSWWNETFTAQAVFNTVLKPAYFNNAFIITDENDTTNQKSPRPIWKQTYKPHCQKVSDLTKGLLFNFGYGIHIFWGQGNNLL